MSMTISDANAVQCLLTHVLAPGRSGDDDAAALEQAAYLADRSYRVLSAGRRGDDVRAAWPALAEPTPADAVRTALVIPASPERPVRTVAWSGDALLEVLYREIGCSTVDMLPGRLPDGGAIALWVDDEAWLQAPRPAENPRAVRLLQLRAPLLGNVVVTGGVDAAGATLGLTDAQVLALTELCAVTA